VFLRITNSILKQNIDMEIKVLGTGCARCKTLEQLTRQAVESLQLDATIEKVEDIQKIISYGIMRTPGLVVDGRILIAGDIPSLEDLKDMLTKNS
jgi:small redox-active disulfide protein 2